MAGNVWEWTSSQYLSENYDATDGRKTLRGGGWYSDSGSVVRCATRFSNMPVSSYGYLGFRVASPGF
jgi:formylglycine-generating enzyme required for sulfatase activity